MAIEWVAISAAVIPYLRKYASDWAGKLATQSADGALEKLYRRVVPDELGAAVGIDLERHQPGVAVLADQAEHLAAGMATARAGGRQDPHLVHVDVVAERVG